MHILPRYAADMDTPADRLKLARERAGFSSAREAAQAMDLSYDTYAQHESGIRGYPAKKAEIYARRFRVSAEWLLFGKGDEPAADATPSLDELEAMVANIVNDEVTFQTKLSDLPHIVASGLHEQLRHFRSGLASHAGEGGTPSPGKGAQSPSARTSAGKAG
jgi:transcriptional regulator with XRE-family HTH domain